MSINRFLREIRVGVCIAVNLVFGYLVMAEEKRDNNLGLLFTPVREEFVNELPARVREFPMSSMMPVVFRGAAKNWGAMKWTPESLAEKGFDFKQGLKGKKRNVIGLEIKYYKGERFVSNQKIAELLAQDTKFSEDYNYSIEFYPRGVKMPEFSYLLFVGATGASLEDFHTHEAVLLAEFYGEKLVFLMDPSIMGNKEFENSSIADAIKKYEEEGMTMKEAINKLIGDEDSDQLINRVGYSPLQRVILRPGDILYIPAGWNHSVFYLNDSIGVSQKIEKDNVNLMDPNI